MRTLRSKRQRALLWRAGDGKCCQCGCELREAFHADHIVPWSETGRTNVHEMQALCQACNLRKGSKMTDRSYQAEMRTKIAEIDSFPTRILVWCVPGGGKSRLPGILAQRFSAYNIGWFVPRLTLQSQAVADMQRDFGIVLRDSGNDHNPSRGTRGFVATHDSLSNDPVLWRDEINRRPYILIVDECHHAKINRDGTRRPLASALSQLSPHIWLNMTGTLETNDGLQIYGMAYDDVSQGMQINPEKSADIFIRYDRVTALRERAIVPIEFHRHDGPVKWSQGDDEKNERLSGVSREDESAAIFTALRTDVARHLFDNGLAHWKQHKSGKLIVVVHRQRTAEEYAKLLRQSGLSVALAIDDNPDAVKETRRFCEKDTQALVTCMMAYEGLDAKTASHIICLTHIRSVPWIEQMLGRVWRGGVPGKNKCFAFVPDDPRMNRVIEKIAKEQPEILSDREEDGHGPGGGEREAILALDGLVDEVNQQFLDPDFATSDEAEERIMALVRERGFTGDEPEVKAFLHLLKQPRQAYRSQMTLSEQEELLRNQINDRAKQNDAAVARKYGRTPEWGSTLKELYGRTCKSIRDMGVEELKRAFSNLQKICVG